MQRILAALIIALCFISCDTKAISWDKVEEAVTEKTEDLRDSILRGEDDGVSAWIIPEEESIFDFLGEWLEIIIAEDEIEISGNIGYAIIYTDAIPDCLLEDIAEEPFSLEYTKENGSLTSLSLAFRSGRRIECIKARRT